MELFVTCETPIPGHATAPAGRLEVETDQFEVFELIVKSDGKSITTFASVPAPLDDGVAHAVPERVVLALFRSNRT